MKGSDPVAISYSTTPKEKRSVRDGADRCAGTGQQLLAFDRRGAARLARCGAPVSDELGEAEVQDLRLPAIGHEDVGRLDVAMDDVLRVRGIERVRNLDPQLDELLGSERPPGDAMLQRLPFEELHHDKGLTRVLVDVVDRADVRVIQRRRGARLALKAFERLTVVREIAGEELQRDLPAKLHVFTLVDDPHAAATEFLDDAVVRNGLADHERWLCGAGDYSPAARALLQRDSTAEKRLMSAEAATIGGDRRCYN